MTPTKFMPTMRARLAALACALLLNQLPAIGQAQAELPPLDRLALAAQDKTAQDRAMAALARALLAQSAAPVEGAGEAEWLSRLRLLLVAGEPAAALDALASLRARQAAAGQTQARLSFLQYELLARARLAADKHAQDFAPVFEQVFRESFAALDGVQAYRAAQSFAYDLERGRQDWQRQLLALPADEPLTPAQARDLLHAYQPWQAYRSLLPLAPALLEAEELRRYRREQVAVRGPDGSTLSAFVVLPRAARTPLPAALVFTIYAETSSPWREAVQAAAHGYAGVIAFSRGKLASPDPIAPYEHEARDVNVVIDWIASQPWSNGRVGMYGGSYNGFAQWAALKHPHPALKTIVPYVAAIPGLGLPMENNVGLTANYGWAFYVGNNKALDDRVYNDRQRWNTLGDRWFESGRPYREIDQVDGTPNPLLQRWLSHPDYGAYWQAMVPQGREYARIGIPVLSITGYYDDGQISSIEYLKQHEAHHPRPQHVLLIGPYDHVGAQSPRKPPLLRGYAIDPAAQFDTPEITFQWLDHQLRGGPRPALLKDRINFELMGANRWLQAPSLQALNARSRRFYLSSEADGRTPLLTPARPQAPRALEQRVDLADRKHSGNDYYPSPIVRRELDTSSGYTFVSVPLERPMMLAGTFSGLLRIAINKRDVDLGVTLYELTPQGDYLHLSYFLGRASYARDMSRRRLLHPGRIESIPFTRTRMVARQLQAGSRLVVQLNVNKNGGAQLNHGTGRDVSDESIADAGEPLRIRWYGDSYVSLPLAPLPPAAAASSSGGASR